MLNTRAYVDRLIDDPRYRRAANDKVPQKIGSRLVLFDCITCDKCIPVCPNDANFTFVIPAGGIPVIKLRADLKGGFIRTIGQPLTITRKHQIANFADFCNECGNCDVFCPEDGGPYVLKPRFFGSLEEFTRLANLDGFFLPPNGNGDGAGETIHARFNGRTHELSTADDHFRFRGAGFELIGRAESMISLDDLSGHIDAATEVDLTYLGIMKMIHQAMIRGPGINFVNA